MAKLVDEPCKDVAVELVTLALVWDVRFKLIVATAAEDKNLSSIVPTVVALWVDVVSRQNTDKIATGALPFMLCHDAFPVRLD